MRERCHPRCYAAFAIDPDGHNVEAVFHRPEPRVTRGRAARWVESYLVAWRSNALRTSSRYSHHAVYFTAPRRTPWRGRREIVEGWIGRADDQGEWDFSLRGAACDGDTAYARGWTIYEDGVVGSLWEVKFGREWLCRSFTEWWMVEEA